MPQDYTTEVGVVAEAISAVYENKQTNKKNSLSGDYSTDNASYPTCKAVNAKLEDYVTSSALNTILSSYVTSSALSSLLDAKINVSDIVDNLTTDNSSKVLSAKQGKLLKADVDLKVPISDIKDNLTSSDTNKPLSANQGSVLKGLIDNIDLSSKTVNVVKQSTAETGYASTYYITQGGVQVGAKINIEKDKMLRSISIETVGATPTQEESDAGMTTGDKYILMIVNTVDNDGTSRLILPITDVFDLQTADETTLTLSAGGVFSIKANGVDTTQLKNGAVTADKIASAVKNSWLTTNDVENEISAFATALANAINPSS